MSQEEVMGDHEEDEVLAVENQVGGDPLPDARDPGRERERAAQHDAVVSQMRKRMSSAQFRPDDENDDGSNSTKTSNTSFAAAAGGGGIDASFMPPSVERTGRTRAASLAAQIPINNLLASDSSALVSNNSIARRQQPQQKFSDPAVEDSSSRGIASENNTAATTNDVASSAGNNNNNNDGGGGGDDKAYDGAEQKKAAAISEQLQLQQFLPLTQEQQQEQWRLRRKHIFIFTDAGKPVFTRWGDESDFSELFGILQVLMEMSISNGLGALKHVCLGSHDVHFFSDGHLRFVMVTATGEPPDICQHQLRLVCHCLLSGCPTVNKVLERNSSYDIRNQLLHPNVFKSLIKSMNHDVPLIFQGIDCGFFEHGLRGTLNEALRKGGFAGYDPLDEDGGGHLMSLIVCRGKILAWGQIPNFQLSTDDLLLLIHFSERCCGSGSSMENTWAPLCLPDYDKEGSFWVHVMQLAATNTASGGSGGSSPTRSSVDGAAATTSTAAAAATAAANGISTSPLLIQLATHTEAIANLKTSAQRVKAALAPYIDKIARASAKVMSLPTEWSALGVMHVLFNRWGVLAYTAPPLHATERKHRKQFLRTLLQVRAEALSLSKTSRPFLMRASPFETLCFSRKVVRLKSAAMGKASAELFVTFLPGTDAAAISVAVNRIWDTMLNKDAWVQFVAPRQNFNI